MTRDEIIDAIRALDSDTLSERQEDKLVLQLQDALPNAQIIALLFFTTPELTAEEIADEALRRVAAWRAQNN